RRARRKRGWTMRSARAAAAPTRSPDCRAARSEPRARRRAPARDACSRSLRRRSREPPATAAARQARAPGGGSRESLRHAQQSAAGAWISLELPELVVDEHAQRLKGARRRMLAGLARAHRGGDERGELTGAVERLLTPRRDDRLGHAAREPLFSESRDHLTYLVDARASEPR